jgi:phosphatidylglycerophosphate synthase
VADHPDPDSTAAADNGPRHTWLTWANSLTLLRLLAIGPAAWAIVSGHWLLAALLFTLAALTDLADGPLARRYDHATPMGGLFDHGTDALFVSITLGALAAAGYLNPLLPVLVALAFIQYMFDSKALAGAELRTSLIGRNNGIAYFVMVGIPVVREALQLSWPPLGWIAALAWLLVLSTAASMLDRAITLIRQR